MFTLSLILILPTLHSTPRPPPPPPPKGWFKNIQKALHLVNWEKLFDQKDINVQVVIFHETILDIFRNYAPNKYITVDDKDPVWMNKP